MDEPKEEEIKEICSKTYIYRGKESRIVETDDLQGYYSNGWGDFPGFTGKMVAAPVMKKEPCPTCGQEREVEVSVAVDDEVVDKGAPAVVANKSAVTEKAPVVDEPITKEPTKEEADPLDAMTKAQLLEKAKEYGITPDDKAKKADIIRIIKSCQGEAPKKKAS